jgi:membrane protein implicated in regulation of membrane protease activity
MNIRYLFKLAGFASGVILISYLSRLLPFDWKVSIIALIIISAMLAFLLRLLNIRSLFKQFGQPAL